MSTLQSKTFGAILLIAGTAIGVGMLGLPITTGASGITASVLMLICTFCFMLSTLFLFLEAMYFSPDPSTNLIGLCRQLAGPFVESLAWMLFLSLLYIASAAYMIGGGEIIVANFPNIMTDTTTSALLFALFFGSFAFLNMTWIDRLNRLLILGLISSFIALIFTSAPQMKSSNLIGGNPALIPASIPVVVTAFTSHIILPSIRKYLDNHLGSIRKTIMIGCALPLFFYLIWEFIILGLLPYEGPHSLLTILESDQDKLKLLIEFLDQHYSLSYFSKLVSAFSFFAIATSFWGVMISLTDFIQDGLNLERYRAGHIYAILLAFIPPIALILFVPSGFTAFLTYAGLIILVLYCFMPIFLVWNARYNLMMTSEYTLPGGKATLVGLFTLSAAVLTLTLLYL